MKILVTGAAGFIGSHLSEKLLEEGHTVVGVDNFDPFYDRSLKEANLETSKKNERFSFYENDICDAAFWAGFSESGIDAVIHMAAKAGVRPSMQQPLAYNMANIIGTNHVLEFAKTRKIPKVVFASSSSVYGVNKNLPWSTDDKDLQPISVYAFSKQSGEKLCELYHNYFGVKIVALRFFTVIGPRQRPDLAINKFVKAILNGDKVTLFGTGSTFRDYTFVGDVVKGIIGALHFDNANFEIFNIGNTHTVSLLELVHIIEDLVGNKADIEFQPEQQGDVPYTWSNIEKSTRLLGYEPSTDIRDGIAQFIQWLKARA